MYAESDYVVKRLEVFGGPADGQILELMAPGAILRSGPFQGVYEEEDGKWRFTDIRLHQLLHREVHGD